MNGIWRSIALAFWSSITYEDGPNRTLAPAYVERSVHGDLDILSIEVDRPTWFGVEEIAFETEGIEGDRACVANVVGIEAGVDLREC